MRHRNRNKFTYPVQVSLIFNSSFRFLNVLCPWVFLDYYLIIYPRLAAEQEQTGTFKPLPMKQWHCIYFIPYLALRKRFAMCNVLKSKHNRNCPYEIEIKYDKFNYDIKR